MHLWSHRMKITESNLRKAIRKVILEKGGTHTFHGNKWPAEKVGFPGPRFEDEVPVSTGDVKHALNWINKYEPDEIVAYSRGSAVLHKLALENPDVELPEITYIAPAAKRDKWGTKDIKAPRVTGRAIASSGDGAVPVKQVCQIAKEAGVPVYVVDGKYSSEDKTKEGLKNHVRILKYKSDDAPGRQLDVDLCLKSELPSWGSGLADSDTLDAQERIVDELLENVLKRLMSEAKKKVKCPLKNGKRDYKCEYRKYGGASKKGKKDRAARNQARKVAKREGRVKKGDGKEIDHKKPLSKGGSNAKSNQRVVSRTTNRKKGNK